MATVKSYTEYQNKISKIINSPLMEAISSNIRLIQSISYPKEILKVNENILKSIRLNQELISASDKLKIMSVPNYINYDFFQYINQINNIYKSFGPQYTQILKMQEVQDLTRYINKSSYKELALATATIQDTLSSLKIDYNNICIDDIDVESVDLFIHDMSDDTETLNWEQKLANWINKVKTKYPVLLWLLCGIITNVLFARIAEPINNLVNSVPNFIESISNDDLKFSIDKEIKGYMKENIYNDFYEFKDYIFNTYRFINYNDVYLRRSPKMKSYAIEKFNKGDVVKIIRKNNHWSYVEYENKDGEILNGWINTRYTKRFD